MYKEIPLLTAGDVELRIAQIQQTSYGTYATLLAYKNARVDIRILNDVFGNMNWTRSHSVVDGRLFCEVSVYDEEKNQWVSKQDVGVPSNTEAVKGEVSDAFKRACFSWSIGIELYSAPEIRIKLNDNEVIVGTNGKPKTYAKFYVADDMKFDREKNCFTSFTVLDKDGNIRFSLKKPSETNLSGTNKDANTKQEPKADANAGSDFQCCYCHSNIKSQKVLDFALKKFGKAVCYECQKKISA